MLERSVQLTIDDARCAADEEVVARVALALAELDSRSSHEPSREVASAIGRLSEVVRQRIAPVPTRAAALTRALLVSCVAGHRPISLRALTGVGTADGSTPGLLESLCDAVARSDDPGWADDALGVVLRLDDSADAPRRIAMLHPIATRGSCGPGWGMGLGMAVQAGSLSIESACESLLTISAHHREVVMKSVAVGGALFAGDCWEPLKRRIVVSLLDGRRAGELASWGTSGLRLLEAPELLHAAVDRARAAPDYCARQRAGGLLLGLVTATDVRDDWLRGRLSEPPIASEIVPTFPAIARAAVRCAGEAPSLRTRLREAWAQLAAADDSSSTKLAHCVAPSDLTRWSWSLAEQLDSWRDIGLTRASRARQSYPDTPWPTLLDALLEAVPLARLRRAAGRWTGADSTSGLVIELAGMGCHPPGLMSLVEAAVAEWPPDELDVARAAITVHMAEGSLACALGQGPTPS